jgi:LPS sulfotransferase NodH
VTPPLIVLGVSRSGTTLLRVILDRSPTLAIPDESFFVPLLARRHRRVDPARFLDDLARIPTLREWGGIAPGDVAPRLRAGMPTGAAIAAVFEAYAERQDKPRWGDKTPMYMRHLGLLERLFPDAQYVHLIRDGRDVALSFLDMPEGTFTRTWAHPTSPREFACEWRVEVEAARALGARVGPRRYLEVRYEELVANAESAVVSICDFAGARFESAMLDYVGRTESASKLHQQRLAQPPTVGVRDWRHAMSEEDVRGFEGIAGGLLSELGYERRYPAASRGISAGAAVGRYRARLAAWNTATVIVQRSPVWARRHPRLS